MSQYDIVLVKTHTGAIDLQYYTAEANRQRSEVMAEMLSSFKKAVVKLFTVQKDMTSLTVNRVSC
ncbi:MAG: RSP_7527 family protein [Pseudomonadales bacterium]